MFSVVFVIKVDGWWVYDCVWVGEEVVFVVWEVVVL